MVVLVTGGAGYLGSHTVLKLLKEENEVIILDNFLNSNPGIIKKLEEISQQKIINYNVDLNNFNALKKIFKKHNIDSIIHFAGLKSVSESVEKPLKYYMNNINSTLNLIYLVKEFNIDNFVFSSSATVYGKPKSNPISEDFETSTTNPYARTKLFIEKILKDFSFSNPNVSISILRYFNPIGAHKSGLIGDEPKGVPNNLIPYISQVASGRLDELLVFGNDYGTKDGTGVRDYIHVEDLSTGHLKALNFISLNKGYFIHNLGTGKGYTVLEVIKTYEKISGKKIKYRIVKRRQGDIGVCYAKTSKAESDFKWKANKDLEEMLKDSWNFEKNIFLTSKK